MFCCEGMSVGGDVRSTLGVSCGTRKSLIRAGATIISGDLPIAHEVEFFIHGQVALGNGTCRIDMQVIA